MTRWQHTIAQTAAHCASWAFGLSALLAATSCKFDEAEPDTSINSCVFDSDCESKLCRANRCVAKGSDNGLDVTLEVTPKRMPDGSQPFPIAADPFALKGGKARFDLHLPVEVQVHILDSSKPQQAQRLEAQISFRPKLDSRFASKATLVTTVGAGAKDLPAEIKVLLLSGVNYDVFVQPMDATRPPHALEYQVDDEQQLEIDYGTIMWESRRFRINPGLPGKLTMRAISKTTGQPISSSAPVGDGTNTTLLFEPGDPAYTLEIVSADQAQKTTVKREDCPGQDKIIPTITIDAASLKSDSSSVPPTLTKDISKDVAKLLTPVVYTGVIQHCATDKLSAQLMELQVDFKRSNTSYGNGSNTFSAAYELSTTATRVGNGQFEFCARVPPGEYVVIVTPPLTDACERFAERRTLVAADDANGEISDAMLKLRDPVKVSASVVSTDGTPVPNATVELVALGTAGITLAEDDATVPLYNRSRQATTDAAGKFMMVADIGNYDVVIKPPALSNLAWLVAHDVALASRTVAWSNIFRVDTPVAVTGTLLYQGGDTKPDKTVQQTLAAADVHAYAIVPDENNTSARSVEIGRAQADEMGSVTLLLSQKFAEGAW